MHYVILYHVFKVVRPHTKPLSRRGAVIATLILWTLSFTVTLPYAFNMEMVDFSVSFKERARSRTIFQLLVDEEI
ncbi:hypothetical protein ANCDUO_01477 [Ancylostoma duodenale]|uniref:G-protein coupled receptors family 1 profile domain-containing protein n=1 Tax=Ancylostoma duodenale TaxID=51022 RepID=A0A0C2H300_9BILA|nr:hypothetical protein ANCDUO_01477 [Ancylostoma duodenale]